MRHYRDRTPPVLINLLCFRLPTSSVPEFSLKADVRLCYSATGSTAGA